LKKFEEFYIDYSFLSKATLIETSNKGADMTNNSIKRKFRTILSADVKGYNRTMGEDEVGTY
jgi:hypothetical protein